MPQFEQINTFIGQIFWLSIFFVILLLVLQFKFIPKLKTILERRSSRIARMLEEASIASSESESIKKELSASADITYKKVQEILEQAKSHIRMLEKEFSKELSKKLDSELLKARNELEKRQNELLSKLPDLVKDNAKIISDSLCIDKSGSNKSQLNVNSIRKASDKVIETNA